MKRNVTAFLSLAVAFSSSTAFVMNPGQAKAKSVTTSPVNSCSATSIRSNSEVPCTSTTNLGMSVVEAQTNSAYDTVTVDLSDGRDYPIYIGDEFDEEEAGKLLRSHVKGNRALIVTNDRIDDIFLEKYEKVLKEGGDIQVDTLVLPDGEAKKDSRSNATHP